MNIKTIGKGPNLLLIHGFLENHSMWDDYLDDLSTEYKCTTIDLPGHGDNNKFDYSSLKDVAQDLLSHINFDNFSIIGHSLGGYVALELQQLIPERIRKVVLLNSNFWTDTEEKKLNRNRSIEVIAKNKNLFIQTALPSLFIDKTNIKISEMVEQAKEMHADGIIANSKWMRDRKDFSKEISANISLVHGDKDPLVDLNLVIKNCKESNCKLIIQKEAGHMSLWEMPKFDWLISIEKALL
jgi:pimeloyl-ACP methyl ester carboxylesterase